MKQSAITARLHALVDARAYEPLHNLSRTLATVKALQDDAARLHGSEWAGKMERGRRLELKMAMSVLESLMGDTQDAA